MGGVERREEEGGDDDDGKRWRGVVRGPLPGPCPSALSHSPFSRTWYQAAKSSSFLADMPSLVSFLPDERGMQRGEREWWGVGLREACGVAAGGAIEREGLASARRPDTPPLQTLTLPLGRLVLLRWLLLFGLVLLRGGPARGGLRCIGDCQAGDAGRGRVDGALRVEMVCVCLDRGSDVSGEAR